MDWRLPPLRFFEALHHVTNSSSKGHGICPEPHGSQSETLRTLCLPKNNPLNRSIYGIYNCGKLWNNLIWKYRKRNKISKSSKKVLCAPKCWCPLVVFFPLAILPTLCCLDSWCKPWELTLIQFHDQRRIGVAPMPLLRRCLVVSHPPAYFGDLGGSENRFKSSLMTIFANV